MDTTQPIPVKSKWRKRILVFLFSIIALFVIYVLICGISYSKGSRTGVVVKLSQKGFVFKTYEGQMNLGGITSGDGTLLPTKVWDFSIQKNDTATFNSITRSQGKEVHLYYTEVLKSFFWQADTKYFVTKVEIVK